VEAIGTVSSDCSSDRPPVGGGIPVQADPTQTGCYVGGDGVLLSIRGAGDLYPWNRISRFDVMDDEGIEVGVLVVGDGQSGDGEHWIGSPGVAPDPTDTSRSAHALVERIEPLRTEALGPCQNLSEDPDGSSPGGSRPGGRTAQSVSEDRSSPIDSQCPIDLDSS